jgi:MFS family permease
MQSLRLGDKAKEAFRFVLIIGVVNLFADLTYEGARSLVGPFLGSLGASAAAIGFVAGFGELMGYGLRAVSGYFGGRTHKYWTFAFAGYAINMLAVPALALAGNWPLVAVLVVLERTGRAIRRPNVEAMISHAGKSIGHGWVFGLNEALDQTGATVGPLVTAVVLYLHGGYQQAFGVLLVPALLCLGTLVVAWRLHRHPEELDERPNRLLQTRGFSKSYWLYVLGGGCIAAGFADFSLIAFHFQRTGTVAPNLVPVLYATAMAAGAVSSLLFGWLLDRLGTSMLFVAFLLSALFAPCVFAGGLGLAVLGMVLWGCGMGAQDSLLKAVLAGVIPPEKRSMAFGVFDTGFGLAWFAGSAAMGLLYAKSIAALIILSVGLQLLALPVFAFARWRSRGEGREA